MWNNFFNLLSIEHKTLSFIATFQAFKHHYFNSNQIISTWYLYLSIKASTIIVKKIKNSVKNNVTAISENSNIQIGAVFEGDPNRVAS